MRFANGSAASDLVVPAKNSIFGWPPSFEGSGNVGCGRRKSDQTGRNGSAGEKSSTQKVGRGQENKRGHGRPAATVGAREPGGSGADWSSRDAMVLVMKTCTPRKLDQHFSRGQGTNIAAVGCPW